MISRRQLLLALGAGTLAQLPALAQQDKPIRRIGYVMGGSAQSNAAYLASFGQGMASLGWVDGRNYVIDARYANGIVQAVPGLADALIATVPDILMTGADDSVRVLAQRTSTIPIVFALGQDPVGIGVAASLQRPGGNTTGVTVLSRELTGKRLQLLKEAFPGVAHIAVLLEPNNVGSVAMANEIDSVAKHLKIRTSRGELHQPADIEPAIKRLAVLKPDAYVPTTGALFTAQSQAVADAINRTRKPAMYAYQDSVDRGGLMTYSPSNQENFRRAASYVDKILKGAKPGDLPIEQPTRFDLVVNLKTARAMGITFPKAFLARADRIIE